MSLHIGIVACSAEGAALCYKTICIEGTALFGLHAHPQVSLHTHSFADYMHSIEAKDWGQVAELMLSSANKLKLSGADFLICPDNTIHQALPYIEARLPLPWLHIAGVVAAEASRRGFKRLALTGTQWLVDSEVYPENLLQQGLQFARPTLSERQQINRLIMEQLVRGIITPEAVVYFQRVIQRLKDEEHCDAVILGCTEIPLIINDENCALPTLDSTRLLAHAALSRAAA
jgi:aspartate racemase